MKCALIVCVSLLLIGCAAKDAVPTRESRIMSKIEETADERIKQLPEHLRARIKNMFYWREVSVVRHIGQRHPYFSLSGVESGYNRKGLPVIRIYTETWLEYLDNGIIKPPERLPDVYVEFLLVQSYLWDQPNSAYLKGERTRETIVEEARASAEVAKIADQIEKAGLAISRTLKRDRRVLQEKCSGAIPCKALEEIYWRSWEAALKQKGELPQ